MTVLDDLRHGYTSPDGKFELHHKDDVPWYEAPRPRRWHRCWAQTWAWENYLDLIERCACGAMRFDGGRGRTGGWFQRNSRKRA